MQNSTPEEIKKSKEMLGEVTKKITVHFSNKGLAVDTTETGVSTINLIQAMLALAAVIEREEFTRVIGYIGRLP